MMDTLRRGLVQTATPCAVGPVRVASEDSYLQKYALEGMPPRVCPTSAAKQTPLHPLDSSSLFLSLRSLSLLSLHTPSLSFHFLSLVHCLSFIVSLSSILSYTSFSPLSSLFHVLSPQPHCPRFLFCVPLIFSQRHSLSMFSPCLPCRFLDEGPMRSL